MQPMIIDPKGVIRFHENALVRYLLDNGGIDLNDLAMLDFPREDRVQFAQLIGYSLSGYHELDYVSDEDALIASREARKLDPNANGCRDHGCKIHCQSDLSE